jgi:hypothetical protein
MHLGPSMLAILCLHHMCLQHMCLQDKCLQDLQMCGDTVLQCVVTCYLLIGKMPTCPPCWPSGACYTCGDTVLDAS